jgi:tRNA A-37 threonylcarbamoyl transferase component Bud32
MSSQVGTLLNGRYRLDAQIGAGGMSTVYRAFDTVLERQVAIKLMHREIASDSDQLERFRREARAVAQLNHPHVVGVIDAGEEGDPEGDGGLAMPYIVFEYVEGETLKDRIRRHGRLPIGESVAYAIEIARALGAAHDHRIVHRDVKPQNVLIDEEGTAKVTDFGIARSLTEEGLTADGRVLGTTDYVSPEQALGQDVGPQSDLYSLGVVLFEMLTGEVPFHGENQVAVAMKHVREELPDVQLRRPEASSALAAVVDRATAKDLDRRYASDRELIADLEDVLAIETARSGQATGEATAVIRTLPARARRRLPLRMRHPAALLATLVLIAAAVAVALYLAADRAQHGAQATRNIPTPRNSGLRPFSLKQANAKDYDPFGDNKSEHPLQAKLVVDGETNTSWSTETYEGNTLGSKAGVGIYVVADPTVAARAMEVLTPTKGWAGAVYGAKAGPVPPTIDGWGTRIGVIPSAKASQRIDLDTAGNRFRYYLVWITKLPPGANKVEISEIRLFR